MRAHRATGSHEPLIIAHRGASAVAPENTLAAFARAFHDTADGLELDVHLAHDGVPMVIHDSTLRRTGLSTGVVAEMTSKELSRVDVGSWFNRLKPRFAREEYSDEHVPTLAEVFCFLKESSTAASPSILYIELKGEERRGVSPQLIESTVELVRNHNLRAQVVIISFDLKAVALAKQLDPAIKTGALFAPKTRGSATIRKRRMLAFARDCMADEILLHRLLATRRMIEFALQNMISPAVWTVDYPAWVHRARNWGIHALITNNPAKLKAA